MDTHMHERWCSDRTMTIILDRIRISQPLKPASYYHEQRQQQGKHPPRGARQLMKL